MIGAEFGRDGKEVEVIKNYKGHGIMESRDRQSPERKQRIEENNCICRDSEIFRIYIFSSQFFFLMLHCIKKIILIACGLCSSNQRVLLIRQAALKTG